MLHSDYALRRQIDRLVRNMHELQDHPVYNTRTPGSGVAADHPRHHRQHRVARDESTGQEAHQPVPPYFPQEVIKPRPLGRGLGFSHV